MWIITLLSITGVILNIRKHAACFVIWGITNTAWFVYDLRIGAYPQAAVFAVYLALSIYGLFKWTYEWRTENETEGMGR